MTIYPQLFDIFFYTISLTNRYVSLRVLLDINLTHFVCWGYFSTTFNYMSCGEIPESGDLSINYFASIIQVFRQRLGDAIDLDQNFKTFCNRLGFQSKSSWIS